MAEALSTSFPLPDAAKLIPGYPCYAVDESGVVYSCRVYGSPLRRLGPWWAMKLMPNKQGYLFVNLFNAPRKFRVYLVHQLVLLTFVGPIPAGQEPRHLDDNHLNNSLTNLCYGTPLENRGDALRNGCIKVNENSHSAKLSNADVLEIRRLAKLRIPYRKIGLQFGVSRHYVARIACGEIWKHLPSTASL